MTISIGILTAPHIEYEMREHSFLLRRVRIGIGFHWDRYEDQEFEGELEIRKNPDGTETAINHIELEQYLTSVISSEMSADSPMELLKAHAVIARSWVLRNLKSHDGYDVCADDHCQRYEGILRRNPRAIEAVEATRGQVLMSGDVICDCRYYKCCGGRTEIFSTCWDGPDLPYLQSVECDFCRPGRVRPATLRLVLNNYDQETTDYHDWTVSYTQSELRAILLEKSGVDFGEDIVLTPLHRGPSGRIDSLRITGTLHTETIGKELKIRQWLSHSCLYSSNFEVNPLPLASKARDLGKGRRNALNGRFESSEGGKGASLSGHGWGHGVGLCQIGAAEMAIEGYDYQQILFHYYPNTRVFFTQTRL